MKKLCCCFGLFFLTTVCHSGTVKWDVVNIFDASGTFLTGCDHAFYLDVGDIACQVVGYKTLAQNTNRIILSGQNWASFLSYPHAWRELQYNELVDSQNMIGDFNDYFFIFGNGHYNDVLQNLTIYRGQTVFLGFFIEVDLYINQTYTLLPLFGWVELYYNGSYLEVMRSAIETTGKGIYVGTGLITPEPSTALLALSGCAVFFLQRRRKSNFTLDKN